MSLTYAIADLHGRFDLLIMALMAITNHAGSNEHQVITLGDYVDRGPNSAQILDYLSNYTTPGLICLKGNHEDIMWQTCCELPYPGWWLQNGGGQTLISYGHPDKGKVELGYVVPGHLDWIEKLPLMHVDKHRIYVHAGLDRRHPLQEQEKLTGIHGEQKIMWMLYGDHDEGGFGDYHIVHGHHQFADGPILKKGRTDLDTFAWYTGRLVVGVFDDDKPGGPIDLIEVKGKPSEHYREETFAGE